MQEYINEKIKVANDVYKINDIYYSYDEAYEIVKRDYLRDEVHVEYMIKFAEIPGIILKFD